jgi:acyl carrier protein
MEATMAWSKGWWNRVPGAIDLGRGALAAVIGRALDGRVVRDDDDALLRDIEPRLRVVMSETLGIKVERIDMHATLDHDLGIDPLDVIDLVTRIEATFGVAFPEGEIDAMRTFEDLLLVTRALVSVRTAGEEPSAPAVEAKLRLAERRRGDSRRLERVLELTPYDCETLADDIASSSGYERRELIVSRSASPEALALVDRALLSSRLAGYRTVVRRSRSRDTSREAATADRTPATNAAALRIARHAVDMLDCLSNERGMTLLHLASNGTLFEADLQAARSRTNRRVAALRTVVRTYARVLAHPLRTRLDAALERLGDLGAIRAVGDEFAVDDGDVLDAYHDISRSLTRYVWTLELGLPDPSLVPQQMCLSALVAATEAGGVERAMIGSALARDVLTPADRADVAALIAQQHAQLDLARRNAPEDIATLLGRCAGDPLFASVADYESRVLDGRPETSPGIDPTAWFRAMTAKLDRLHDVEVQQLDRLMRDSMREAHVAH